MEVIYIRGRDIRRGSPNFIPVEKIEVTLIKIFEYKTKVIINNITTDKTIETYINYSVAQAQLEIEEIAKNRNYIQYGNTI